MSNAPHDDEFDSRMRALHADAVIQVSPRVRHRLRVARGAASTASPASRFGWPAAGAFAAALVLAVALPLRPPPQSPSSTTAPSAERSAASAASTPRALTAPDEATVPTSIAVLEESPEFYLWLASNDAGPDGVSP